MFIHYLTCIKVILSSIIKAQLIKLPSKRVIWLVIVLVVIAVSVLWYAGYRARQEKEAKIARYTQDFLTKQKNIEAVAIKGLQNDEKNKTLIEKTPNLIISTSTATLTTQLQDYNLAVIKALESLNIKRGNEPQAVIAAIDKNDPSLLRPVVESRIYHQTASKNLAQVIVPKELSAQHKKLIGDINFLVSILHDMEMATDQPQSALTNSKAFMNNYSVLLKSINDLNQYLSDKGLKLETKDQIQVFVSFVK